jgi:predicted outer membrane repeat protein
MNPNLRLNATLLAAMLLATPAPGRVIYVDEDAPAFGNGQSWATAYRALATAVSLAQPGDEIWVAAGRYVPPPIPGVFQLPSGVRLYGGFAGNESSIDDRDWVANRVTLDGDTNGDDLPGLANRADNAPTLIDIIGADPGTVIDGVELRGGFAPRGAHPDGGAIRVLGGEITVANCRFAENGALDRGGAIFAGPGTSLVVRGSLFNGNATSPSSAASFAGGGAIWAEQAASVEITGCSFDDNASLGDRAFHSGGAVAAYFTGTVVLRDCGFEGNRAVSGRGNAATLYAANASVVNCDFLRNGSISDDASAVFAVITEDNGRLTAVACRLLGNPGIAFLIQPFKAALSGVRAFVADSLIAANGTGLFTVVDTDVTNCTITGSNDPYLPWGILVGPNSLRVENSILWGNGPEPIETLQVLPGSGPLEVNNSIVQGWTGNLAGVGSFSADPLFTDLDGPDNIPGTADDNHRLSPFSPAIDAGDNSALPADAFDLDGDANTAERISLDVYGNPRRADDASTPDTGLGSAPIVDIGAAEFQLNSCLADSNGDGLLDLADITAFIAAFIAGEPPADLDGSGIWDLGDILLFIGVFNAGCP